MKKTYLLFAFPLFLLLCFSSLRGQNWVWGKGAHPIAHPPTDDEGEGVAIDKMGNIYFIGEFMDTLVIGHDTLKSVQYRYACFLMKYDKNGNFLWARQSTGKHIQSTQYGYGVAVDKADNVYITGNFKDTSYFGSHALVTPSMDAFVVKYDSVGNVKWAKQSLSNSIYDDNSNCISVDGACNVYISGNYEASVTFDKYTLTNHSYFLTKYDSAGNVLWAQSPNLSYGNGISLASDAAGYTYLTGEAQARPGKVVPYGKDSLHLETNIETYFTAKYSPGGEPVWVEQCDSGTVTPKGLTIDGSDNVVVTGYYLSTAGFAKVVLPNSQTNNLFLLKLDSAGTFRWAKTATKYEVSSETVGYSVTTDQYHSIYLLAGYLPFTASDSIRIGTMAFHASSLTDFDPTIIAEFDSSGNIYCGSIIKDGSDDYSAIAANPAGDYVYWGGDLTDTSVFGPDTLGTGFNDYEMEWPFLAKWKTCNINTAAVSELNAESEQVKVYPNPSNGVFTFQSSVVSGKSSVEIYNVLGEKVYSNSYQPTANGYQLNLSNQPNGIYLYRVISETGGMIGEGKLVKQ